MNGETILTHAMQSGASLRLRRIAGVGMCLDGEPTYRAIQLDLDALAVDITSEQPGAVSLAEGVSACPPRAPGPNLGDALERIEDSYRDWVLADYWALVDAAGKTRGIQFFFSNEDAAADAWAFVQFISHNGAIQVTHVNGAGWSARAFPRRPNGRG